MTEDSELTGIASCGGKLTLAFNPDSEGVSLDFQHSGPTGASLFQVGISLDGESLEYWPIHGVGMRVPEPPSPMVSAFVVSDKEMFFGRTCPICRSYFRTTRPGKVIQCPYCDHRDVNVAFTTKNQILFINKIRESFLEAYNSKSDVVIDLDEIASRLEENRPPFAYSEESQQNRFSCPNCKTKYDVLGEYAGCPTCGKRNSLQVFEGKLKEVQEEFERVDSEVTDREDRKVEWEKLTRCISDFEGMARDLCSRLTLIPSTPRRKQQIEKLGFQNINQASQSLQQWCGIQIMDGISESERQFLVIMSNRRHILVHNAGRVDQEYLDKTGDTKVKLNQQISVKSREIKRLLRLLKHCANNFYHEFESIS